MGVEAVGVEVVAPAVAAEQAVEGEARVGEPGERPRLRVPRVPAGAAERRQLLALRVPRQRVAGEEQAAVDVPEHAAHRVAGDGEADHAVDDLDRRVALQEPGGVGRGGAVVGVDPDLGAEVLGVALGVADEELLMLADIIPTGYEVGVLNGAVSPGDVVAVVGAGPIGLATVMGAKLYSPAHVVAIDKVDARLEAAKGFGADVVVNNDREDPIEVVRSLTEGLGADVAVEAVGVPATLHLEELWIKDVAITTGLVDTYSTPTLLKLVTSRQVDARRFLTHHFT